MVSWIWQWWDSIRDQAAQPVLSVISFFVSVARGMVVSGILIYALPALAGADSIWFAMPITELFVAIIVVIVMISIFKKLLTDDER